jgi:hypothetical protein
MSFENFNEHPEIPKLVAQLAIISMARERRELEEWEEIRLENIHTTLEQLDQPHPLTAMAEDAWLEADFDPEISAFNNEATERLLAIEG